METPKKKKNSTRPRLSFWRQHYPLIFAIGIFISGLLFIVLTMNVMFGTVSFAIYPVLISLNASFRAIFNAIICIVLPIIFFCVVFARGMGKRNSITIGNNFIAFGLISFVAVFICAYIYVFVAFADEYTHKAELQLENRVYMLIHHATYPLGNGSMEIFECENLGLFCSKIYERGWGNDTSYPTELAFDAETQEISIVINGEVIYTHPLEDQ